MTEVEDILKFRFSSISYSGKGSRVITQQCSNQLEARISILKRLSEKVDSSFMDDKPLNGIREIYLKFKNSVEHNQSLEGEFDRRELRTLTYALNYHEYNESSIFNDSSDLITCLELLERNWRDSYISGLLDCFLTNWNKREGESFDILSDFLLHKVESYQGSRAPFLALKKNSKFFDKRNGDLKLGYELALQERSIIEATKYLGFPDDKIAYPYFAGVINGFLEKSKQRLGEYLDDIHQFLDAHGNNTKGTSTNKLIVSKVICKADQGNDNLQDRVKNMAFSLVGDPGKSSLWLPFEGATDSNINTIEKAQSILNQWLTKQFINVFFEKCIDDRRRKAFWLKHAKDITSFKVIGSKRTKYLLKQDDRISEFVDARYSLTYSKSDVSAFIIYMKNHVLIEFSKDGYAFIGYRKDSLVLPDLNQRFAKVDDLRAGELPMAVRRKYETIEEENEEGRLFHKDGNYQSGSSLHWEEIFDYWLNEYVL